MKFSTIVVGATATLASTAMAAPNRNLNTRSELTGLEIQERGLIECAACLAAEIKKKYDKESVFSQCKRTGECSGSEEITEALGAAVVAEALAKQGWNKFSWPSR